MDNLENLTQGTKLQEASLLRDQIADLLRVMIIDGTLAENERISERKISQMLNVSTTPVKEAFRVLHSEGLIYSIPRKGSYIASNSKSSILQLVYIRSALEGITAYFAATAATEDDIQRMTKTLEEAHQLILSDQDPDLISKKNDAFHDILRECSHNSYVINIGKTLRQIGNSVRKVDNRKGGKTAWEVRHKEHLGILEAIKNHQADEAEQRMISHVRGSAERVV